MKTPYLPDPSFRNDFCCDLTFETMVLQQGHHRIAGIDEVGRGALFGPVCAAAVVLSFDRVPHGINDSKKLTANQRLQLAENIREAAQDYSIAFVESWLIDQINILEATREAMRQAIKGLRKEPDYLLCDGITIPGVVVPQKSIIKGDARSLSIAAASILAKVERDRLMYQLGVEFPGYDFGRNKGYATAQHRNALRSLGPTPYHRLTFRGVRC